MPNLVEALKTKLVAVELRDLGITEKAKVLAIAARVRVDETGALIGLDKEGNHGVGSGPGYHLSVADVARDMGETVEPTSSRMPSGLSIQGNPFRQGPDYSLTGQMILMKADPVLAEDMAAEAGVSLRRNDR